MLIELTIHVLVTILSATFDRESEIMDYLGKNENCLGNHICSPE